jgi:hypothetical protein
VAVGGGLQTGFALKLSTGSSLVLVENQPLTSRDLPGLVTQRGVPVATVTRHPQDPSVLGLKNLTASTWNVLLPNGSRSTVEPQRNVRLARGTRIDFGPYSAEVL